MNLTIPRGYRAGFSVLYQLPDEKKERLVEVLAEAPRGKSIQDLTVRVSLSLDVSLGDSQRLIRSLAQFYTLANAYGKDEILGGLPDALIDADIVADGQDATSLIQTISGALEAKESLGTIAKAKELAGDCERLFVASRILTDFRPIFSEDLDESITVGVVVHQLRITYHEGEGDHPDFFVALDGDDLKQLKEDIIRAEKKEAILKKDFDNKGVSLLSMDGLHSTI